MNKLLLNLDSVLRSTPSALLTYFNSDGEGRIRCAEWVGIICSEPALLTVCIKRPQEGSGEGLTGRDFVVNLPSEAQIAALPPIEGADRAGAPIPADLMVAEAEMISAPLLTEAPIRLECRRGRGLIRFDQEVLSAPIAALHIGERLYGRHAPPDLYRLAPFAHPLIASHASERKLESIWRAPHPMPENSTCF